MRFASISESTAGRQDQNRLLLSRTILKIIGKVPPDDPSLDVCRLPPGEKANWS